MTKLPRQLTAFSSALVLAAGSVHSLPDNTGISFAMGQYPRIGLASFALLFTHMLHSHVEVTEAAVRKADREVIPAYEDFPMSDDENFYITKEQENEATATTTATESGRSLQDRYDVTDKKDEKHVKNEKDKTKKEQQLQDYISCSECLCQMLPRKVLAELNQVSSSGSPASSFRSAPPRTEVPESAYYLDALPDSTPETAGYEYLYDPAAAPVRPLAVPNDFTRVRQHKRGLIGIVGSAAVAFAGGFGVGFFPPAYRTVRIMLGRCMGKCPLEEAQKAAKGNLEQYCKLPWQLKFSSPPKSKEEDLEATSEENFFEELPKSYRI